MIKLDNVKAGDTFVFYRDSPASVAPGYFYTVGARYTVQEVHDGLIYMTHDRSGSYRWSEEMFNYCFSKSERKTRKVKRVVGVYQLVRLQGSVDVQVYAGDSIRPVIGGKAFVTRWHDRMTSMYPKVVYRIHRLVITPEGTISELV